VKNQIFNLSPSEELTAFDYELLRGLQIQPPTQLEGRSLIGLSTVHFKDRLNKPFAWIGLAMFSGGAIMLSCWLSFLIQKLEF
jgi:hypothetical protein